MNYLQHFLKRDLTFGCGLYSDKSVLCRKPVVAVKQVGNEFVGVCQDHVTKAALTSRLIPINSLIDDIIEDGLLTNREQTTRNY